MAVICQVTNFSIAGTWYVTAIVTYWKKKMTKEVGKKLVILTEKTEFLPQYVYTHKSISSENMYFKTFRSKYMVLFL